MCFTCENLLYDEHRLAESGPFDPCPECHKFASNDGRACYHCFSIGATIDECPECCGKPWSEEVLRLQEEIRKEAVGSIQ